MTLRYLLLFAGALALLLAFGATPIDRAAAADVSSVTLQSDHDGGAMQVEGGDGAGSTVDDQRVDIQLWTLLAAGGAMALGLVLLGLRLAMGWVKPPPPQEDVHH